MKNLLLIYIQLLLLFQYFLRIFSFRSAELLLNCNKLSLFMYTYISEKYKSIIHFALQYLENLSLSRHLSNHYNHISIQRCHLFPKNFSFNENGVQFDTICFPSFLCLWQKISLKFSPLIIVHACVWSDHLSSENRPYLN